MKKQCAKCKLDRLISEFSRSKSWCNPCMREYTKTWKANNRTKVNKSQQTYIENHEDYYKQYYSENRAILLEKHKEYNKIATERKKAKLKLDSDFKMRHNLRQRLKRVIKKNFALKSNSTEKLLGCKFIEVKKHLESKFLPTMTWENYGQYWHIDHIIPCASFDLTKEEEQQKCFNYTNLQPLFAVTTIIDGITYIGNINKGDRHVRKNKI
jgi:hypothetical protein